MHSVVEQEVPFLEAKAQDQEALEMSSMGGGGGSIYLFIYVLCVIRHFVPTLLVFSFLSLVLHM